MRVKDLQADTCLYLWTHGGFVVLAGESSRVERANREKALECLEGDNTFKPSLIRSCRFAFISDFYCLTLIS